MQAPPKLSIPAIEYALGYILLAAATLKANQLLAGSDIAVPGLLGRKFLFTALIQSEVLLAFWLLVGGFARPRFYCAVTCFALFAVVSIYEAIRAMPSCGCFGNVKVRPTATAVLDISAVIALYLTRARHTSRTIDRPPRRRMIAGISAALILSGGLWTIYFLKVAPASAAAESANGSLVVLDPASWVNHPFPLFDEIDGAEPLRTGRWLVVFYHFDCDDCRKAIPDYQTIAMSQSNFRVAFVAMPPFAEAGSEPVMDSEEYPRLRLREDHDWFTATPVVAAVEDGQVLATAQGEQAVSPPQIAGWKQ